MDIYRHDDSLRQEGFETIAGIDEAGRGPLAGPVVASAVVLPPGLRINGLRDSKAVPEKERELLFRDVLRGARGVGIGIVDAETIDRINILKATVLAMELAVNDLGCRPDLLLIDALKLSGIKLNQRSLVKGESKSASIAAASIIAKVTRDRIMRRYDEVYPQYGFSRHKGYSTKDHVQKLLLYGPCPIHRMTFEKVKSLPLPLNC